MFKSVHKAVYSVRKSVHKAVYSVRNLPVFELKNWCVTTLLQAIRHISNSQGLLASALKTLRHLSLQ